MNKENQGQEPESLSADPEFQALNPKEQKFILAYLKHFGAQKAAQEAGYSKQSAHTIAYRLLKKSTIQSILNRQQQKANTELEREHNITKDSIRAELAKIAFATADDFGNWAIGSRGSLQIKMADKIHSLELLGKIVGLFDGDDDDRNKQPLDANVADRLRALESKYLGQGK